METLLVQPENNEQLTAIKNFLKTLSVNYKTQETEVYNAEWEAKMKRSEDDLAAGRTKEITTENLWQ